jgi:hypothetical protein
LASVESTNLTTPLPFSDTLTEKLLPAATLCGGFVSVATSALRASAGAGNATSAATNESSAKVTPRPKQIRIKKLPN